MFFTAQNVRNVCFLTPNILTPTQLYTNRWRLTQMSSKRILTRITGKLKQPLPLKIRSIAVRCQLAVMETHKQKNFLLKLVLLLIASDITVARSLTRRSFADPSVKGYLTERTCWWNEVCKEEFQSLFRCKCPAWSFCRAPGRYYNAYCSMTATGYLWTQPGLQEAT